MDILTTLIFIWEYGESESPNGTQNSKIGAKEVVKSRSLTSSTWWWIANATGTRNRWRTARALGEILLTPSKRSSAFAKEMSWNRPSFNSSIISFLVLTYLENLFPLWFMLSKIRSSTISLLYEKIPRQPQISTVFFLKNFATRKFIFSMVRFVV